MSTDTQHTKNGVTIQCDTSLFPAPHPETSWPLVNVLSPTVLTSPLTLALQQVSAGAEPSSIQVTSAPISTNADWTLFVQQYQGSPGTLPAPVATDVTANVSAAGVLSYTISNPMQNATVNVWLESNDGILTTTLPFTSISTTPSPLVAATTAAQGTATGAANQLTAIANSGIITDQERPTLATWLATTLQSYSQAVSAASGLLSVAYLTAQAAAWNPVYSYFNNIINTLAGSGNYTLPGAGALTGIQVWQANAATMGTIPGTINTAVAQVPATATTAGVVKAGTGISIAGDGTISAQPYNATYTPPSPLGDGSTLIFTVNHNLATKNIIYAIWQGTSSADCTVDIIDTNNIRLTFHAAPASATISLIVVSASVITGSGGAGGSLPAQAGYAGCFLSTNGVSAGWNPILQVPSPTGNNNAVLVTNSNGTGYSWSTTALSAPGIQQALLLAGLAIPALASSQPVLPNTLYPVGSQLTVAGVLYTNQVVNSAQTWVPLVSASNINGQITASQIASISSATISGALNQALLTQIGSGISGLTASQISSVNSAALSGCVFSAAQITSGTIATGLLNAGSVCAALVACGQLSVNLAQIANLNALNINANQINAGWLTAGAISANAIQASMLATDIALVGQTIRSSNFQSAYAKDPNQWGGCTCTGWAIYSALTAMLTSSGARSQGMAEFNGAMLIGGQWASTIANYVVAEGGGCCVREDTAVTMGGGTAKCIKDVQLRDRVLCYDLAEEEHLAVKVVGRTRTLREFHLAIKAGATTIFITPDHPLWVPGKGWSICDDLAKFNIYRAKDLIQLHKIALGDALLHQDGTTDSITSIDKVNGQQIMWTLAVKHQDKNFLANGVRIHNGGAGDCVGADTLISTPSGPRKIKDLEIGDLVMSHNDQDQEIAAPITAVVEVLHDFCFEVTCADGTKLAISADHPLLTVEGWRTCNHDTRYTRIFKVSIREISPGDLILAEGGKTLAFASKRRIRGACELYTLGVSGGHTFIANGLIVHDNWSPM